MMMCYGLFVFSLKSVPFQKMTEIKKWDHPKNARVNARPAYQFTGIGEETLTLEGALYPEITGGRLSLALLERMNDQGYAWPLIEGTGIPYGFYITTELTRTKTEFFSDGSPRKIDFILSLAKVDPPEFLPQADLLKWI